MHNITPEKFLDKKIQKCYNRLAIRELDETQAERKSVFNYDFDL